LWSLRKGHHTVVKRPATVVVAFVSNPVTHDARVLREAESLAEAGYDVTVVAHRQEGLPEDETRRGVRLVRIGRGRATADPSPQSGPRARNPFRTAVLWLKNSIPWAIASERWYRRVEARVPAADVYHGHDLTGLAMAARVRSMRGRGRLVYDSHELFMESGQRARMAAPLKRLWTRFERALARRCDAVVTVNSSIAAELQVRLQLAARPIVVMNCPARWHPSRVEPPERDRLRERLSIPAQRRILLYQGGLGPDRGLEQLPRILDEPGLESAALVYLGYGPLKDVLRRTADEPSFAGRVFVLDAVPPADLLDWTASADVSLIPFQHTSMNNWLATPNKLFESLAAGVPVVASRFPELEAIITEWRVGELCDPTSVPAIAAATLRILGLPVAEYAELRRRCRRASLERYNWEKEVAPLLDLYRRLAPPDEAPTSRSAGS
jgi:glycosyltransferase involved in cell wall biosynthesis